MTYLGDFWSAGEISGAPGSRSLLSAFPLRTPSPLSRGLRQGRNLGTSRPLVNGWVILPVDEPGDVLGMTWGVAVDLLWTELGIVELGSLCGAADLHKRYPRPVDEKKGPATPNIEQSFLVRRVSYRVVCAILGQVLAHPERSQAALPQTVCPQTLRSVAVSGAAAQ